MKNKTILILAFAFLLFLILPETAAAQDSLADGDLESVFPYTASFVISGYYSPLPGQTRYVTGSYESDIRLNGGGVHGADGTPVFPGMIAAGRQIPYGTKIEIPGIGITSVHDRGGAINNKRLDIWMGHGELGMMRALAWGMRTVQVTVYGINDSVKEEVFLDALPLAQNVGILVRTKYFKVDIGYGDQTDSVKELQRFLKKLGFYKGFVDGYYGDSTREAVIGFQLQEKIIPNERDSGTGHFGPQSRVSFEARLEKNKIEIKKSIPDVGLKRGNNGEEVARLQGVLIELGLLEDNVNEEYDENTVKAVFEFQKKHNIVSGEYDIGAGYFGPQTRQALLAAIEAEYTPNLENLKIPQHDSLEAAVPVTKRMFTVSVKPGDKGDEVKKLQEELKKLNFLRIEPTGYYGPVTEHALFKLQQYAELIENEKDDGAGYLGPKTREFLNEIAQSRYGQETLIALTTDRQKELANHRERDREVVSGRKMEFSFEYEANYGDRGEHVKKLQEILKQLGYFKGNLISNYFGNITRDSLIAFQMTYGIIDSEDDMEAGTFSEKTRDTLKKVLEG